MTAWANDGIFEFKVLSADSEKIVFRSKSDGVLINGKGVHIRGDLSTDIGIEKNSAFSEVYH